MAGSTVPKVPTLFLVLLLFPELHAAGTFASASSAQNLPDTPAHHPSSTLWMPQASHHGRRGPGKKDRGPGLSSRAQEGAVLTAPGQASRITLGQRPAGLLQDKEMLLGQALPSTAKETRYSGWERMKKRGREHKRRRDRLRLHRGRASVRAPTALAQPRSDGDVMPTLDMALFDWTDYEDLKPEAWPSAKKKEKHWSHFTNDGNETSPAEGEPCDHHQDCLP
ncbi:draxin-like, partial [Cricetulus griseus]|uniref:draxin-like n=1 Tax=Cricetulus griseus TaxID=10029 RepID=UPI0004548320